MQSSLLATPDGHYSTRVLAAIRDRGTNQTQLCAALSGRPDPRVLVPWEPPPPPPAPAARASNVDEASAAERLASLQLLAEAQHARFAALASIVERAITAPAFADPRAATLLVLPLLAGMEPLIPLPF